MAKLTNKRLVLPDAGRHLCTLSSVQEVENKFYIAGKDSDDKKQRLEWTFVYDDRPEMQIKRWSSFNLSAYKGKKSTALELTEALLGKVLTVEEREKANDTDELIGKKCFLTVKHEKNEAGEITTKIIDVEPATEEEVSL